MKRFVIKIILFGLPIIILLFPVILILAGSGESYTSIDSTLENEEKYLIGYAYNKSNYRYIKWKNLQLIDKNEIIALGSSRVLQFRANMFDSSFYNAGFTISSISDFLPFLQSIPKEKYPKILIIGLDQWMFNKNWDGLTKSKTTTYWKNAFEANPSANTFISVYKDLFNRKYGLSVILNQNDKSTKIFKVGLNAIVNNKGFRKDGSMSYGNQIDMIINNDPSVEDYLYQNSFDRIKKGNRNFEYGDQINPKALEKLEELLSFCKKNNIEVVGFLPPFAKKVYQKMTETKKYQYVEKIYPSITTYFKKYNFELWDMSDIEKYNSSDSETIDGFHGGEVTYLKILIYMLKNNSVLNNYTASSRLINDLSKKKNNYFVYEY